MNKTKKESAGPRQSKREQLRAERRRRSFIWNAIVLGGLAALVIAVVAYMVANARPGPLPGEQVIPNEGAGHVDDGTPITFQHYPPSSGTHYQSAAAWGVYTEPIPEGTFVHNLEHGGVVFLYTCPETCPELEQQFKDLYDSAPPDSTFNERKILVTPYEAEKMPAPVVALAWGYELDLEAFDADLLLRWYRRFVNRGPELVR